jgi:hypothetical protein
LRIREMQTSSTFVLCGECGNSIYVRDPESTMGQHGDQVLLRCRNNCCGHVAWYSAHDQRTRPQSRTIDHTTNLLFH